MGIDKTISKLLSNLKNILIGFYFKVCFNSTEKIQPELDMLPATLWSGKNRSTPSLCEMDE